MLLADDAYDVRVLMRLTLRDVPGVEVVGEAEDGRAAVAAVEQLRPDLVLLDLSMPVLDGLQALPLVLAAHPPVKVLVVSGSEAERMAAVARDAGAHGYLEKGGSAADVARAIAALFPERALTA